MDSSIICAKKESEFAIASLNASQAILDSRNNS